MPVLPRLKIEEADWRSSQSGSQLIVGRMPADSRKRFVGGISHCIGKEEFKIGLRLRTRGFPPDGLIYYGLQVRRRHHCAIPTSPIIPREGSAGKLSKRTEATAFRMVRFTAGDN